MGVNDLWVRDISIIYMFILLGLIAIYYVIQLKWRAMTNFFYQAHLLGFEMDCAYLTISWKKKLFKPLYLESSSDENLRIDKCIRILEIGVKTGENIPFYPQGTHLIGVDWNTKLQEYLTYSDRAWEFTHIKIEKLIVGDGSNLKSIPSGSVDAVVSVRSLCSTTSIEKTLEEIQRVLAPGKKYFFLEHVPEKSENLIHWLQWLLTKTKIWPSLFGNCHLDCDSIEYINRAKFSEVNWKPMTLRGFTSHPYHLNLSRNHVMGVATK